MPRQVNFEEGLTRLGLVSARIATALPLLQQASRITVALNAICTSLLQTGALMGPFAMSQVAVSTAADHSNPCVISTAVPSGVGIGDAVLLAGVHGGVYSYQGSTNFPLDHGYFAVGTIFGGQSFSCTGLACTANGGSGGNVYRLFNNAANTGLIDQLAAYAKVASAQQNALNNPPNIDAAGLEQVSAAQEYLRQAASWFSSQAANNT